MGASVDSYSSGHAPHEPPDRTAARDGGLSWQRLVRASALANVVLLLALAAVLGDAEAGLMGLGFVIALVLLHFRRGLLSNLLLLALFLNVLGWMVLGTLTNVASGESLLAVAMPAALTSTSATGLLATLGGWRRFQGGAGPLVVTGVGGALFAAALLAGVLSPTVESSAADIRLHSDNVLFDETTLEAQSGEVIVELSNGDLFWHTFTIDELGVDLAVPVSGTRQATFDAAPGTYTYYCRVPGHETRMVGTLTVR